MNAIMPYLQIISHVVIIIMYAWLAKKFADLRTTDIDDDYEIEENSNAAIGFRRSGLYLGGMIAMSGVLVGASRGYMLDTIDLAIYGFVSYVLLFVSRQINDSFLLSGIDNDDACKKGNTAVSIVEFGSYVATGLIIFGCIAGDGSNTIQGIISTVVFFVVGQVILLILARVYEAITAFDCIDEIKLGNNAAAIMIAGKTIALGFILRNCLMDEPLSHATGAVGGAINWAHEFISFGQSAVVGIVLLVMFNYIIDHLFLPNTNIHTEVHRDKNIAATMVHQAVTIGFSLIIAGMV